VAWRGRINTHHHLYRNQVHRRRCIAAQGDRQAVLDQLEPAGTQRQQSPAALRPPRLPPELIGGIERSGTWPTPQGFHPETGSAAAGTAPAACSWRLRGALAPGGRGPGVQKKLNRLLSRNTRARGAASWPNRHAGSLHRQPSPSRNLGQWRFVVRATAHRPSSAFPGGATNQQDLRLVHPALRKGAEAPRPDHTTRPRARICRCGLWCLRSQKSGWRALHRLTRPAEVGLVTPRIQLAPLNSA